MSYDNRNGRQPANLHDESDVEEEALVNDYKEQVHFEDGMSDLERTTSMGTGSVAQDLQAQLAAAATPLEYQATLETKFSSYDNYCNLFHYILNSDGPVDLEVPSVCVPFRLYIVDKFKQKRLTKRRFNSTTGRGM
jgi:translation initiation factor 3 subunit L